MKLEYFAAKFGNFGDDLNPWLWPKVIPGFNEMLDDWLLVGIGTIYDDRVEGGQHGTVIFGTGVRDPRNLPQIKDNWYFFGVRGRNSTKALNLPDEMAIGDPAYLLAGLDLNFSQEKKYKYAFMPHISSIGRLDWKEILAEQGIHYITPTSSVDKVLQELLQTENLITEAMHGAIVADAFRIPWTPVRVFSAIMEEENVNYFKWGDWLSTIDVSPQFYNLPAVWPAKGGNPILKAKRTLKWFLFKSKIKKIKGQKFYLSSEKVFSQLLEKQQTQLSKLNSFLSEQREEQAK